MESQQSQSDKSKTTIKRHNKRLFEVNVASFISGSISGFTTAPEQMCGAAPTDQFTCLYVPVDGRRTFLGQFKGSSDLTWSIFTTGEGRMVVRGATQTQM